MDWSRAREQTKGFPKNFISYGTVGHMDATPQYARIEDGDVLVEVTLVPSGDEVIARLDFDSVDGGGSYFPVSYGQRVLVGFPGGETGDPVIIGRCSDASWPFPSTVAGIAASDATGEAAPMFAFIRTQDGQLLAIESGDGADVLVHSGGSMQHKVNPGEQVLVTGRTHIGSGVDFATPPTGSTVGANGFVTPGEQGGAYVPAIAINATIPPPAALLLPEDGVVRIKDRTQSNIAIDPGWWAYITALTAFVAAWTTETTAAGILAPLYPSTLSAAGTVASTAGAAQQIESLPMTGSKNTIGDD
jgi:hypothetical protein